MPTSQLARKLSEATIYIRNLMPYHPRVGITLGSGLSQFADRLEKPIRIPYQDIPHFSPATVAGHSGQLVVGLLHDVPVAVLQGRIHFYEGHSPEQVVFPTRVLGKLGVEILLLTNAAGGLDSQQRPGDFMIINDHINLTGANPLIGPNEDQLGPRFVDMSSPYDPDLLGFLKEAVRATGHRHTEGVYCGVSGPSYETAAEIRYLGGIGGKAVGMSTVMECIAARHMNIKVAGLSCITNLGTGLSTEKVTHEEVQSVARLIEEPFEKVLLAFVSRANQALPPRQKS